MGGVQTAGIVPLMESPQRFVRELNTMNVSCSVSRFNPNVEIPDGAAFTLQPRSTPSIPLEPSDCGASSIHMNGSFHSPAPSGRFPSAGQ